MSPLDDATTSARCHYLASMKTTMTWVSLFTCRCWQQLALRARSLQLSCSFSLSSDVSKLGLFGLDHTLEFGYDIARKFVA